MIESQMMAEVMAQNQEYARGAFDRIELMTNRRMAIAQQEYAARRYRICRWLMGMENMNV